MRSNHSYDKELLRQIAQAQAGQVTGNDLIDELAHAIPRVDPEFNQQLMDYLVAQLNPEGETLPVRSLPRSTTRLSESVAHGTGRYPENKSTILEEKIMLTSNVLNLPARSRPLRRIPLTLIAALTITLVVCSILIFTGGYGSGIPAFLAPPAEYEPIATIFERYIENVWNEGNLEEVSLFLTDDHIHHDANVAETITGLEAVSQYIAQYRERIPGLNLRVDYIVTEGDTIAADLTATTNTMTTTISMSSRFTDDKLAEVWFNASSLLSSTVVPKDCEIEGVELLTEYPAIRFWFEGYGKCYSGSELTTICNNVFTEDVVQRDLGFGGYHGCNEITLDMKHDWFPEVSITIDDVISKDDQVYVRSTWVYKGEYSGFTEFFGTAAQFDLVDDQVNAIWFFFNLCETDLVKDCEFATYPDS
jgi:predicted SnoaL-like aldol condensation-catalyzing enzyme